ncbi:carbohydrate sulfotransferase 11-like [Ptychodera flava]|uniref:carbohydrate sulfotransferase 11-like n=1 Tax=Ptychodera flava TaxID=63121 RepID=UPI003969FDB7
MNIFKRCFASVILVGIFFAWCQYYLANQQTAVIDSMIKAGKFKRYRDTEDVTEWDELDNTKEDQAISEDMRKRKTLTRCRCAERKHTLTQKAYKYVHSLVGDDEDKSCSEIAAAGEKFREKESDVVIRRAKYRFVIPEMYVDDSFEMLYCPIPKVATSNWRRVMMVMKGHYKSTDDVTNDDTWNLFMKKFKMKRLSDFKSREREFRLRAYTKVMFVRNPLERLLSAYRDKFEIIPDPIIDSAYGKQIRKFGGKISDGNNGTISFADFVQYLVTHRQGFGANHHWQTYEEICRPCEIEYDIIGKYETLTRDANFVLRKLGASDYVKFPEGDLNSTNSSRSSVMTKYYSSVKKSGYFSEIVDMYRNDFSLFGYSYEL